MGCLDASALYRRIGDDRWVKTDGKGNGADDLRPYGRPQMGRPLAFQSVHALEDTSDAPARSCPANQLERACYLGQGHADNRFKYFSHGNADHLRAACTPHGP